MNNEEVLLWESFKNGDWDSYTKLYNIHFKLLNNYGHKFTRDTYLIEDAVHDLFTKLWRNKANLGTPVSAKNYLFKSFRGVIFRKIQTQTPFSELNEDYQFVFEPSYDHTVIANEEEALLRSKMKQAIETLPARQREIVYLRFYEGFSYDEISDIMGINVSSSYKLLYKALSNLQNALNLSGMAVIGGLMLLMESQLNFSIEK